MGDTCRSRRERTLCPGKRRSPWIYESNVGRLQRGERMTDLCREYGVSRKTGQENVRHERMHRTLKLETTRPAKPNLLQQQEHFDAFREVFNSKRPHEALDMRRPAELYTSSLRLPVGAARAFL